ncbi:unnamed protein product [Mytilus coruscus]|uniref:Uncharacterized protein n=1 Tax=Mytilus coruscus TaxID=42192 RepID=A0A6J8ATA5_MYTCO|nr:unnamed protein product [Mytilus coruscus]
MFLDNTQQSNLDKASNDEHVIICVYMPTRGGNVTIEDFKTVLDELSEMIEKYLPTSDIIIGDFKEVPVFESVENIEKILTSFSNITTAKSLCPKRKKRFKRKREWTPEMTEIVKVGTIHYWKWKNEGNKNNKTSINYIRMKEQKKKLRSAQRRLAAEKRENAYTKIMELNEKKINNFLH